MKKNRKTLSFLMIGSILLISGVFSFMNREREVFNDLTLMNIEALAAGEDPWVDVVCYGSGSKRCPINDLDVEDYVIWYKE